MSPGLRFNRADLLFDQRQPHMLARDLAHQVRRQGVAVSAARALELLDEAPGARLQVAYPLAVQQALDAVDVHGAFLHQPLALAPRPACVLLLHRGRPHHAAHPPLAALVAYQHPHQLLQIQSVGLGPPRSPVDLDARRVEHPALHTLGLKPAVQPEAVVARLVAAHDAHRLTQPFDRPAVRPRDVMPHRRRVATWQHVTAQLGAARRDDARQPLRLAQFKRNVHRGMLAVGDGGVETMRRPHGFLRRLVVRTPNLPLGLSSPHRI